MNLIEAIKAVPEHRQPRGISEIEVVESLINELSVTGVIITVDALHCQKKHSN